MLTIYMLNYPYFNTPPIPGSPCDSTLWPDRVLDVKSENDVYIFPNPAHSYFQIICSKNMKAEIKYLFDSTGQLVWKGKEDWVDVSMLRNGIYYLRCRNRSLKVLVN